MEINTHDDLKWIKINAEGTGYYVVNYDKLGWKRLIDQLKEDHTVL